MNKPSKYTTELLHFLEDEENYPEMIDWIEEQPELDQPDILREMEAIFKDRYLKTGEKDWLDKANFIANGIDDFDKFCFGHCCLIQCLCFLFKCVHISERHS